ncbi:hypothetical protein V7S43_002669 [Phytophthora oleae]|uniref:Cyclic nucleotide-binding domain-containing protein n=1 Tax=Phytophthora oleae TaxID=2107226 RepID=A0ABD3FYK5_9STRA
MGQVLSCTEAAVEAATAKAVVVVLSREDLDRLIVALEQRTDAVNQQHEFSHQFDPANNVEY